MPRTPRLPALASFALLAALVLPRAAAAQEGSIYHRAAKAFAVDTFARKVQAPNTPTSPLRNPLVVKVRAFVASPFEFQGEAPSQLEIDSAYRVVSRAALGPSKAGDPGARFSVASILSPLGGLPSEADLVLGLADFMVERAKDELVFAFVDDLRRQTRASVFLSTSMPGSFSVLQRVDAMSFQALMPALRASVAEDLASLPARAGTSEFLDALKITQPKERAAVQGLSIAYARVREIRGGMDPVASLANLRDLSSTTLEAERARVPLVLVGVVAREYGVYQDSVQSLLGRPETRRLFAAFLAHDLVQRFAPAEAAQLKQMVRDHEADLEALAGELAAVRRTLEDARTAATDSARRAAVLAVTQSALGVVRSSRRFAAPEWQGELPAFDFVDDAAELYEALADRNYPAVVGWLAEVGRGLFQSTAEADRNDRYALRFLSFAATLAAARSAPEVTAALRTVSAPVGSFRLKRGQPDSDARPFSLSLTGFVGATGGWEVISRDSTGSGSGAVHAGPAVPVGLEASLAVKGGSVSLFFPVLDLGNLASLRLGGENEEETPEVGFRQVLSPGLFVVFGLTSNRPFALGVGVQSASNLRQSESGGALLDVWRVSVFGGIDVTLLKF